MLETESISVVIPTFNRRSVLDRAIVSVLGQTAPAREVIVVDDGSTDGTSEHLARTYSEIRVIRQQQMGVSAARNNGIRASTGSWIALLDSDDEWQPRKLEMQSAAIGEQDGYRICHTDEIWIRRGDRVNPKAKHAKSGGWIFSDCLSLCVISPSAVMLERSLLDEVGMFDEDLPACEDYDLWLRICSRYPVLYVDEPLVVKYGGHSDQLSRVTWGLDRFRILALDKLLAGGSLTAEQRRDTMSTLVTKIDIFVAGADKRGKIDQVKQFQDIRSRWLEAPDVVEEVQG